MSSGAIRCAVQVGQAKVPTTHWRMDHEGSDISGAQYFNSC